MNTYQNTNRLGVRTSTSVDPKVVVEDINENVRRLDPEAVPLQVLSTQFGRGKAPVSKKIQVMAYHSFDNIDYCSAVTLGAAGDGEQRFARLTLDQVSRPLTQGAMYYQPQDKLFIAETGQVVEVVITPTAAIKINGTELQLSTTITGTASATRSLAGTVVVRNIEPANILTFVTSHVVFMGRTIYESQLIEALGAMRDVIFDCNFVEHKEKTLEMTEDQRYLVQVKGIAPDWTFQQREMLMEMRRDVEYNAFFSERAVDMDQYTGRPKYHMRGLFHAIRTNVAHFDPLTITSFEDMFVNFMHEQAFRYNPTGREKIAMCGGRFLVDFNLAFKDYRRTSSLSDIGKKIGLNMDTYSIGGNSLTLIRSEVLRQNTNMEYWCFVIDPSLAEWRIKKDYESKMYQLANERDLKLMVEWQGTIAWNLEQAFALLRT